VKPCSRDTEKPCGYRGEVPQHNERLPKVYNCVKQWSRPEIKIMEVFQLPHH